MKKLIALMISAIMASSLTACGGGTAAKTGETDSVSETEQSTTSSGDKMVLKLGHSVTDEDCFGIWALKFKEEIENATNGRITVDIYGNCVLGGELDMLSSVMTNSLDIMVGSISVASNYIPEMAVFDMPYLFSDVDAVYATMDGEIGDKVAAYFEGTGGTLIGNCEVGWRHSCNSKRPIYTPEDFKGIKMRTLQSPVQMAAYEAMGAIATPMSWNEVYTALQQKTVDGVENSASIIYTNAIYEVQKYMSLDYHQYGMGMCVMSTETLDSLSDEDKKIVYDASKIATDYERKWSQDSDADYQEKLKAAGMEINECDLDKFREATKVVYDKYGEEVGYDLITLLQTNNK